MNQKLIKLINNLLNLIKEDDKFTLIDRVICNDKFLAHTDTLHVIIKNKFYVQAFIKVNFDTKVITVGVTDITSEETVFTDFTTLNQDPQFFLDTITESLIPQLEKQLDKGYQLYKEIETALKGINDSIEEYNKLIDDDENKICCLSFLNYKDDVCSTISGLFDQLTLALSVAYNDHNHVSDILDEVRRLTEHSISFKLK